MSWRCRKPLVRVAVLTAAIVALSGCGDAAPEAAPVVATPAAGPSPSPALPELAPAPADGAETTVKSAPPTPAAADAEETASATTGGEPQPAEEPAEYQPPFPDRVELFVAPKRQGGVRSHGEAEDSVALLGFVRVNTPKVVLSINGEVTPVAEGATEHGIEVISIQPPMVLLQRGRQRWHERLEN